jgi:hypothetical protein
MHAQEVAGGIYNLSFSAEVSKPSSSYANFKELSAKNSHESEQIPQYMIVRAM